VQELPSAPLPGGQVPPRKLGTPTSMQPRTAGVKTAAEQERDERAAKRAELERRDARKREDAKRLEVAADERRDRALTSKAFAPTPQPGVDMRHAKKPRPPRAKRRPPGTPNTELKCTHCDEPRAAHGSYCRAHKNEYAKLRNRALRQRQAACIGNTDLL
jgi:hypothetical protein